jgi:hypothetical protein
MFSMEFNGKRPLSAKFIVYIEDFLARIDEMTSVIKQMKTYQICSKHPLQNLFPKRKHF